MVQSQLAKTPIASPVVESDIPLRPLLSTSSNSPNILGGVLDGIAFLSYDFGVTWRKVNGITDAFYYMTSDPPRGEIGIINESGDTLHISFDQGQTFKHFRLPDMDALVEDEVDIEDEIFFSVSHKHHDWLIVKKKNDEVTEMRVHYTTDSGNTWRSFTSQTSKDFNFVEGGQFAENLVYGEIFNDEKASLPGKDYGTLSYDKIYTQGLFNESSWKPVEGTPYRSSLMRIGDVLIANDFYSGDLAVSYDGIHFHKVKSPENLATRSTSSRFIGNQSSVDFFQYKNSILLQEFCQTNEEVIREWLSQQKGLCSNVFMLERDSVEPKLLLENVKTEMLAEFRCIEPKNGVFIANVVCNPEEAKVSKKKLIAKTVINFDGGSTWSPLAGPNGGELQLNIDSGSSFTMDCICLLSGIMRPAPGVLIAYGDEAEHLFMHDTYPNNYAAKFSRAYLTRDAGRTWIQIDRNRQTFINGTQDDPRTIYIVGANGDVVLERSPPDHAVDHVLYTVDDGDTWNKYELGFTDIIEYIEADTRGSTNRFLLRMRGNNKRRFLTLTF